MTKQQTNKKNPQNHTKNPGPYSVLPSTQGGFCHWFRYQEKKSQLLRYLLNFRAEKLAQILKVHFIDEETGDS